jgi:hypothetical protein
MPWPESLDNEFYDYCGRHVEIEANDMAALFKSFDDREFNHSLILDAAKTEDDLWKQTLGFGFSA